MLYRKKYRWLAAVGIGLLCGLVLGALSHYGWSIAGTEPTTTAQGPVQGGFWPENLLHAVSTDRADTFAIATGPVDADVEAVYFLDFLTGDLGALVLGKAPNSWSGRFVRNVSADLGIDPQKNPKFLMVTGMVNLRRGGGTRMQPSNSMCYVAEITSGKVAAYAVPWSPQMYVAGQMQNGALVLVGATQFRQTGGVGPGAGPGAGTPKIREK